MKSNHPPRNRNDARSQAMRATLIDAAIASLIESGYAKTTGVEVCRRAGVTRGALNHHFPVYSDLLIAALMKVYDQLKANLDDSSLEQMVRTGYANVIRREYKVIIELWLASQNDPDIGEVLTHAIEQASDMFVPSNSPLVSGTKREAIFYTLFELTIAIGLGRATSGGKASAHEQIVFDTMLALASEHELSGEN